MTDLTSLQTGLDEDVPADKAAAAVTQGTHAAPAKPINLIDPETNETYEISDPAQADTLIKRGWAPESKDDLLKRAVKDTVSDNPITSSVAALTGSFTNQAVLGIPKVVRENTGDDFSKKLDREVDAQLAEQHPVLNIAGGVAGMASTLLLTPIGKALGFFGDTAADAITGGAALAGEEGAKSVTKKVIGTAVKYGAENAALNLPYRVTEEVLGDPNTANEGIIAHGAEDFGVGAAFGLGTSMIGPVLKTASDWASKAVKPESLQNMANEFQMKNAGALTSEFKKLGDVTGKKMPPEQIQAAVDLIDEHTGPITQFMGPSAIYNKMLKAKEAAGNALSKIRGSADMLAPDGTVTYSQLSDALDGVEAEYAKGAIKGGKTPIDYSNVSPEDFQNYAAKYGNDPATWPAEAQSPSISDPRTAPDLKSIQAVKDSLQSQFVAKLRGLGKSDEEISQALESGQLPALTFNETHEFRQSIKQMLYNEEKINGIKTDGGNDAWKAIGDVMDNNLKQIAAKNPTADLASFKEANANYRQLKQFTDHILKSAAARYVARNKIGLGTNLATIAGAVADGNIGALGGFAGGYLKQHFGNYLMYQTLGRAAQALEAVTGKIDVSIGDFLSSQATKSAQLGSVSIFSRYMGEKKTDPHEAFDKIQNDLNLVNASPDAVAATLSSMIPSGGKFMPQTYAMAGSTIQTAVQYLKDSAPKPPGPIFPGGPTRPWKPSDNDLSKYSRRMNAVFNPLSILDEMKSGVLSKESVEAVKVVYPNFFQAIQNRVQEKLANAPAGQVYKIRRKLSLLLDGMEDPQSKAIRIQGLQGGFAPNNNQVKPNANSKIDEAGRYTTDINRVTHD